MEKYDLILHVSIVHEQVRKVECPNCNEQFQKRCDLEHHIDISYNNDNDKRVFECDVCNKTYPYERALKLHIHYVHKVKARYSCTICGKEFEIKDKLRRPKDTCNHNYKILPKVECFNSLKSYCALNF